MHACVPGKWNTYKAIVLAAHSVSGTLGAAANTNDGDRRAVKTHQGGEVRDDNTERA